MSLQFVLGNSGSGKTVYMYSQVVREAAEQPEKNFLVIVPEQFTMQTQRELVDLAPNHAIMNIDVLSFQRLAFRVFDELGMPPVKVLEETGKNLVIRRIARECADSLTVLRPNLNRMGYISEIKSLLSEFKQYNITPDRLEEYLGKNDIPPVLLSKLRDILVIYRGFESYKQGNFITAEELLPVLCTVAGESALLRDSVIVFDEFTGFTPTQKELLRTILPLAKRIMVSLAMDAGENPYCLHGEQELFAMSKKTILSLTHMAEELSVPVEDPVILSGGDQKRFKNAPGLFFIEQNLFRKILRIRENDPKEIKVARLKTPRDELLFVARQISKLVRNGGFRYKEIAVVSGAVELYGNYVEEIFSKFEIPFFLDRTKEILFHPFIEMIRAILETVRTNFSYEAVFRFLRCGFTELTQEEIDLLENYVLAMGIRGANAWKKRWILPPREKRGYDMDRLDALRGKVFELLSPVAAVFRRKKHTAEDDIKALYSVLAAMGAEKQLWERERALLAEGRQSKSKEYGQIYRIVMELFEKLVELLGGESMTVEELEEVLDAGFDAAKVATLPPGYDSVTVGDIERTRISHVKILFFVGVNDGIIPKSADAGGIISQYDRQRMEEAELELAPGARERVFIQRFYLYLNLTKPSDRLYVTFAGVDSEGKAQKPSYLIGTLCRMFPALAITEEEPDKTPDFSTEASAKDYLIHGEHDERWLALAKWFLEKSRPETAAEIRKLLEAPHVRYEGGRISRAAAEAVYGKTIAGNVTRLQKFAGCAYAHFLEYGLKLRERENAGFENTDIGNLYHDALERYAGKVAGSDYDWFSIPRELQDELAKTSMEESVAAYANLGIYATAANQYQLGRMTEIMQRTVWALTEQVRKGRFVPKEFEVSFSQAADLSAVRFLLQNGETMQLRGRIDRTDTFSENGRVYVKVIDYKSGNTSFDLVQLYYGLQMQLPVYLGAATELEKKAHPNEDVVSGGILYYHIDDPVIETDGDLSDEEYQARVLKALRPDGLVNREEAVFRAMDQTIAGRSDVIPVELKNSGEIYESRSHVAASEEFQTILEYTNGKLTQIGEDIYAGDIEVNPYRMGKSDSCGYCPYHSVCGMDERIPGFAYRKLSEMGKEEALGMMETENAKRKGKK